MLYLVCVSNGYRHDDRSSFASDEEYQHAQRTSITFAIPLGTRWPCKIIGRIIRAAIDLLHFRRKSWRSQGAAPGVVNRSNGRTPRAWMPYFP